MDCSLPGSSVHGDSPGKNTGVGCLSLSLLQGIFPTQGLNLGLPQADSLPAEPPGKSKNTGVGSLSFLQQIFLTQELNQGLLHCRRILYQLSYQGSPYHFMVNDKNHPLGCPLWISKHLFEVMLTCQIKIPDLGQLLLPLCGIAAVGKPHNFSRPSFSNL